MSGDIVERLRQSNGFRVHHTDDGPIITADVDLLSHAADEIERLRTAGDALAEQLQDYQCHCSMSKCRCGHDAVLDAWQEARNA